MISYKDQFSVKRKPLKNYNAKCHYSQVILRPLFNERGKMQSMAIAILPIQGNPAQKIKRGIKTLRLKFDQKSIIEVIHIRTHSA